MQVSVTTLTGLERRMDVSVPGERLSGEVDQRLKQLARTAKIKGFRQGKVPYAIVKKQFGSQVQAEAVNELLQSSFAEAVSQQQLRPAGGPRIGQVALDPAGGSLRYQATFEVLPEVKLTAWDGIQVERPVAEITDADVEAMIENMRVQRTRYEPVERAAQEHDRVGIDYQGRIDGTVFPGGEGELQVQIGAHRILPELETALVGMLAGEKKSAVAARFPDDYGAKSVAGKDALFDVTVKKVEQPVLPPVDAEFARAFGIDSGDVAELRREVRASMDREMQEAIRARLREQLFEQLHQRNPIDVPKSLVHEQIHEMQHQAMKRAGIKDPKLAPSHESLDAPARQRVALGLLVGEVIRSQRLKVERARVEQRVENIAAAYTDPAEARRTILGNPDTMSQIESAALEEQAVDWMLGQVKTSDKPSSFAELTGFGRAKA